MGNTASFFGKNQAVEDEPQEVPDDTSFAHDDEQQQQQQQQQQPSPEAEEEAEAVSGPIGSTEASRPGSLPQLKAISQIDKRSFSTPKKKNKKKNKKKKPPSARPISTQKKPTVSLSSTEVGAADQADSDASYVESEPRRKSSKGRRKRDRSPSPSASAGRNKTKKARNLKPPPTSKSSKSSGASKKRHWSPEEDEMLLKAIKRFGRKDWAKLASQVPGRTVDQCKQRWNICLNPKLEKGPWTPEQSDALRQAVEKFGTDWVKVASQIPGRSNVQCRQHWITVANPNIEKGYWTPQEDEALRKGIEQCGTSHWPDVAALVPGRTSDQCRTRWTACLNPKIEKGWWTRQEDEILVEEVNKHGQAWAKVAKKVSGRTADQCSKRYRVLNSNTRRGPWTPEEDEALKKAVAKHGRNWVKIATEVGRNNQQCYIRWNQQLDPNIEKGPWTPEEDAALAEAVKKYENSGMHRWSNVASEIPGRTGKQCKIRYNQF